MTSENFGEIVDRLAHKIHDHMIVTSPGWDWDKTMLWFRTRNPLLGGITPDDMMLSGRHKKLEKFIDNCIEGNFP